MLPIQTVSALDTEQLAQLLYRSTPELRSGDKMALKEKVKARVVENALTGEDVMKCMEATKPGMRLEGMELFKKLFAGTEGDFQNAVSSVRSPVVFAQTVLMKIILSHTCPAVSAMGSAIISHSHIPPEYRAPEFDAYFPLDQLWLIQCGQERHITYDSTECRKGEGRKGVHGYSVAPRGWLRIAIKANPEIMETWHKAYHGTAMENVKPIAEEGLVKPKVSKHGAAGAGDEKVIYCSPSIEYAAHWVYTAGGNQSVKPDTARDAPHASLLSSVATSANVPIIEVDGTHAQYVFEVRVKPDAYRVQGNTLHKSLWSDWNLEFDMMASSRNLEWKVENKEDIVVTGVMIRALPDKMTPEDCVKLHEDAMRWHVEWEGGRACRARDYGGVHSDNVKSVVWEWNGEPSLGETLSYGDGVNWIPYPDEISEVIESAYQDYQRFAFIGKPPEAKGPLFIDFGAECDRSLTHKPEQRRADSDREQSWRRRAVRRRARAHTTCAIQQCCRTEEQHAGTGTA